MNTLDILNELATTSSRNDKIAILKKHESNALFKRVVWLALHPRIQFYIRKIPDYNAEEFGPIQLEWALDQLMKFNTRELTGNSAVSHLAYTLSHLTPANAEVISRILAKDLKCGVDDSSVNKAWPKFIPEYPYMRCSLMKGVKIDKWPWKKGILSQIKADGMFCNINHDPDGNVSLVSRSGSTMPSEPFTALHEEIKKFFPTNTQTHGELLVMKNNSVLPREIGNGILTSVLKGGSFESDETPVLLVWDQIAFGADSDSRPYVDRYVALRDQVQKSTLCAMIETRVVHTLDEAYAHYSEMLALGMEGTILKNPEGMWKDGTSKDQVKLKLEVDVDLLITGFTAGKGKNEITFGSITCQSSDGQLVVNVSGFKDKKERGLLTRQEISDKKDQFIGTIMTVRANAVMPPTKSNPLYSLFLPRFTEFRSDKTEADSLQQVIDQFDNAIKSAYTK